MGSDTFEPIGRKRPCGGNERRAGGEGCVIQHNYVAKGGLKPSETEKGKNIVFLRGGEGTSRTLITDS